MTSLLSTADFKKLHEAHFNKMESIDSYVQRKTKQIETLRTSVKEPKVDRDLWRVSRLYTELLNTHDHVMFVDPV